MKSPDAPAGPPAAGSAALVLPDLRYSCHCTGCCCEAFPRIDVDDDTRRALGSIAMESLPEAAERLEAAVDGVTEFDGKPVLRHCPGGYRCVFLRTDRLCELHAVHGSAAKPKVCREFPYRFRATPSGVFVGLSFVCPSVRANSGASVADQSADLAAIAADSTGASSVDEPVLLSKRLAVSWEQYLLVEAALTDLLALEGRNLRARLMALHVFVRMLEAYSRETRGAFQPMEAPRQFEDAELGDFLDTMRATRYAAVMRVAGKHVTRGRVLRRIFLGTVASFGNAMWRRGGRVAIVRTLFGQYLVHAFGFGRVRLEPVAAHLRHRQLEAVRFPVSGPAAELLDRYARHIVFRKDLVHGQSLLRGIDLMLVSFALIRWYAAASAAEVGRTEPGDEDFSRAVAEVEKTYGFHSRFYELMQRQPTVESLLDSFTSMPHYPFVVLGA